MDDGLISHPAQHTRFLGALSQSLVAPFNGNIMSKKDLSEDDICAKYITPAITDSGWDEMRQIRRQISFTAGRVLIKGKLHTRGKRKRADYILSHKANLPLAVLEAK